jgi:O-succinylbenzoate synthase
MDGEAAPVDLSTAWTAIGEASTLALHHADLWLIDLPMVRPLRTARGVHRNRPLALVRLVGASGGGIVEGWGECAALADATYDLEDAELAFSTLADVLLPTLVEMAVAGSGGILPRPSGLASVRQSAPGRPLAFAALEMAVADAHLRAEGRALADVLGVAGRTVALGAVVGQQDSVPALIDEVGALADGGFSRVKVKIGPGWDSGPLVALTQTFPGLRLQADANGAYAESDGDHLVELDGVGLLCLEQPFGRAALEAHAQLAARMSTPVCLDESIDGPDSARRALAMGACSVVCVKPARLGGLGAALDLVTSCTAAGTPLWMGGMFESGFARGVNTTVAALPGFAWPGDLSPASTSLADDLVEGVELVREGPGGVLCGVVPVHPGLGPPPDTGVVRRRSLHHRRVDMPR